MPLLELVLSVYRRMLLSEIIRIQTCKRSLQYQHLGLVRLLLISTQALHWYYDDDTSIILIAHAAVFYIAIT